jgi:hypothetical protein
VGQTGKQYVQDELIIFQLKLMGHFGYGAVIQAVNSVTILPQARARACPAQFKLYLVEPIGEV